MNALAMWTPAFIIGYLLTLAVSITGSVMVGLAVYNDAKSKMSLNAVMWAMLVGILGWIPGIVYLCVRNKPLERIYACYSCEMCIRDRSGSALGRSILLMTGTISSPASTAR